MNIDQVADMLTRIRNAQLARRSEVLMPSSKFKVSLAKLLNKKNYIGEVSTFTDDNKNYLKIQLKYADSKPAIKGLKRVSKQGQRIYMNKGELPIVKNGYGMAIISTSQGLMSDQKARKNGLGGEIICEVW
jgi:small subunit ribosomal protein S8